MDRFAALQGFVATCDHGSFSAAGRVLRLTPTMIAKYVDALEARLGVRLFHRTTRKLTLTEEGAAFREHATALLADLEAAERAVGADRGRPHGTLRLNAPMSYGVRRVAPLVADFLHRHPEVKVEAAYVDRVVDLAEEGWDLAIRIASALPDSSSLVARRVASERLVLCAAPEYLKRHGVPAHPSELAGHACLTYTLSQGGQPAIWRFTRLPGGETGDALGVSVSGRLSANNGDALRSAALEAHGMLLQPLFIVEDDLRSGALVEVLLDRFSPGELTVFAVYARSRQRSAKVGAFVELVTSSLSTPES